MYSRIRHPDSDFQRMRRQQSVLLGIARKLRERGALENLHEADQLTAALRPFVRTTMPPELVLDLLWSMRSVDAGAVQRIVVDTSIVNETRIGGSYALVADESVLLAVGAQLVGGQ
jgi:anionic cell wall polymer biosynthesis LytR-Cps2A-Psr (LCP) family protein